MTTSVGATDTIEGVQTHPWIQAGGNRIRFGIFGGPNHDHRRLEAMVRLAEDLGCDSYWTYDHPLLGPDWATTLTSVALSTSRLRLGSLVTCPAYSHPVVLARQASDIDRLSDGRLVLGLGLGDDEEEFRAMGLPFAAVTERSAMLRESLQAIRGLWTGDAVSVAGVHVRLQGARLQNGLPVQRPFVPVLIAGGNERLTLPLVAEAADMANVGAYKSAGGAVTREDIRRKLGVLDEQCRTRGRSPGSVLRSHVTLRSLLAPTMARVRAKASRLPPRILAQFPLVAGLMTTPEAAIATYQDLVDEGIRYFILRIWEDDVETMQLFAEGVLPSLRPPTTA